MKIDLCLLACDLNPDYYTFFGFVKKCWEEIVGIKCILILVANEIPTALLNYKDSIILFPPLENIPTAFQAQCIRLLYPGLLGSSYKCILISDMDIIPLNREYFVRDIEETMFCVYRNVISAEYKQYPMCYCAGSPKKWSSMFGIRSIHDVLEKLSAWYTKDDYEISSAYSEMWAQDQRQLYNACQNEDVQLLTDKETGFKRLDRADISFIYNHIDEIKRNVINGKYSDFHLPRPYQNHEGLLNEVVNELWVLSKLQAVHLRKCQDLSYVSSGRGLRWY